MHIIHYPQLFKELHTNIWLNDNCVITDYAGWLRVVDRIRFSSYIVMSIKDQLEIVMFNVSSSILPQCFV